MPRAKSNKPAKERYRLRIMEFWSDPEHDFIDRASMIRYLEISPTTFYKHFTPAELADMENEAYENRKKRCSRQRGEVMYAIYKEGKNGNVAAAKEFLDRTEGKVVDKIDHKVDGGLTIRWMS